MFKIIAFMFILYSLFVTNFIKYNSKYTGNEKSFDLMLYKYDIDGNHLRMYMKGKEKIIVNYYFETESEKNFYIKNLSLGDVYNVIGVLEEPNVNTNFNQFNYKKYLYNHGIYYLVVADKIKKIKNNDTVFYYIKNKINSRIEKMEKSKGYVKTFILGDKNLLSKEVLLSYQNNGISHLFSISGMHIILFAGIILYILKKLSYNNYYNYGITILFLIFYMFLTGLSSSVIRATFMFVLFAINKCLNLRYSSIDIMMMVLIGILIINPFNIYDIGFQFSYTISFSLILLSKKIGKIKSKLLKSFYISLMSFIVSFPIVIYNFYQVNLLSIFLNVILIPFVSLLLFPLSLLTFIFPFLDNFLYVFINILENISLFINNISWATVIFSKPNFLLLSIYYIAIILVIFKTKYIICFIFLICIHKFSIYIDNKMNIKMLDVGQGDSILIMLPYNHNALIDTGGIVTYKKEMWMIKEKSYNLANDTIIPYFKSIGVSKIDCLILSHGDYDHMGEAINLVNKFKVEKVIFNCGPYNDLEKELIKVLEKKNIKYYSCIKKLKIDKYKLQFLNTGIYDNENDNSSVIYLNYNNYKFLFMGDAGTQREKDILEKYNLTNIDFLKVGHHGSNTSSSEEFINSISPKYSLISVGKNNRYGHPKESVLDILESSKIYRTDLDGSIEIKLNKNGYKIRTCPP